MSSPEATFTSISSVGEFGLIDRMNAVPGAPADGDILKSIGDDAAVYRIGEGRVHVVTTDALIEGVHFDRTFAPMRHLGAKAIGVNVSDIAAMNAIPRYATIAIGLPHDISVEMVDDFYQGMKTACEAYGVSLIGGEPSESSPPSAPRPRSADPPRAALLAWDDAASLLLEKERRHTRPFIGVISLEGSIG